MFCSLNTQFLSISYPTQGWTAQSISQRFAVWKRNSSTSANRPPFRTELPIYERFQVWNRGSANWSLIISAGNISESFAGWIHDSWASANQPHCWKHCTYFKFRSLKTLLLSFKNPTLLLDSNAHIWTFRNLKTPFLKISIYHLAVRHSPYMNVSKPETATPEHQQIEVL